ncbi:MerR family transcriptional regulator [Galbibacter sp. PAP.153]|uniref:MerR family transcriptional regulator n=1 Tax=Galbibacter sp. PAP.153 TaxID=3104623 RepID=UPI00300AD413
MGKYTIAQIVSLTGIKAHTLRKWEARYHFIKPERTNTNIRYYSDSQLKKLLNISILSRNGYRISQIDKMSDNEIHDTIKSILIDASYEDEVNSLTLTMLSMDEASFHAIIDKEILRKGILTTITDLLYPFLQQVGVLWGNNRAMPAQEHFMSNLIRQKIFSATDYLPPPKENSLSIVLFLPEGENHEIGLLLSNFIARKLGWKTYYLGQSVPTENIKKIDKITNADLYFTMFVSINQEVINSKIDELLKGHQKPLLLAGIIPGIENIQGRATYLTSPKEFIDFLMNFS